jgi:DNA-binding CsgD family transcriptional regulator
MPADGGIAADAIGRRAWGEARAVLSAAAADLSADELEWLATASYLTGRDDDAVAAFDEAHQRHLAGGAADEAARCAFWIAFCLMMQGQMAHAGGWLGRAGALIADRACPAAGYLLVPTILRALDEDDAAGARDLATRAGEIGARFGDRDLVAFSTLGEGQALLALGDDQGGLARLDEVMLAVTADEVGPIVSGIVYCAVILECMQLFDLARAAEWTAALDAWCARQHDLVPYRGQCLVHRSQIEQASGDWSLARSLVSDACHLLADPPHPALGLACYQRGELLRLAGDVEGADAAYREASRHGFEPMPGLALLDLARGAPAAAAVGIDRSLREAAQPFQRPGRLAAAVDIHIAVDDLDAARAAADELRAIAAGSRSEVLGAMAEQAVGSALLAAGSADEAIPHLRAAGVVWQRLKMPYEGARAAALLGRACAALGDHTSADVSFDHARDVFRSLGAVHDLGRLPATPTGGEPSTSNPLSSREREVLALVARGKTNPDIAAALDISRHTVGRHLENIFAKLDVNSRAAATAYAYEHGLV